MDKQFAENLLKLRKEKKLTQQQVADAVGCSQAAIGWYERGDKTPTLENVWKIADVFGVSIDDLIGRKVRVDENHPKTYGDLVRGIKAIIEMLPSTRIDFVPHYFKAYDDNGKRNKLEEISEEEYYKIDWRYRPSPLNAFRITLKPDFYIGGLAEPWDKILKLYQEGSIDKDMYEAWVDKKANELDGGMLDSEEPTYYGDYIFD